MKFLSTLKRATSLFMILAFILSFNASAFAVADTDGSDDANPTVTSVDADMAVTSANTGDDSDQNSADTDSEGNDDQDGQKEADTASGTLAVELSQPVTSGNVVEVLTDDTEEADEDDARALVEEATDEIIGDIGDDSTEEAAKTIKKIEADILAKIDSLSKELRSHPELEKRIMKQIRHLKDLHHKLRARSIKIHHGLAGKIRKIKNHPAVFEVRWGVLNERVRRCLNASKAEIIRALDDNETPEKCQVNPVHYSGKIAVNTGTLKIRKRVLFEKNDSVTQAAGESISFDSVIAGHWDGLIVEYIPDETAEEELEVSMELGDLNVTLPGAKVQGRHDIGNRHQLEVKRLVQVLPGFAKDVQEKVIRHKLAVQDKVNKVQDKLNRLRLLGRGGDQVDELEDVVDEVSEYNFDDTSANEVEAEIETLTSSITDDATRAELAPRVQLLKQKIRDLKEKAKVRKFQQKLIPFKDTDDDQWYTAYVSKVKERGIISGYKDAGGNELGEYRPANNVTVAEILKIALETAEKGTAEGNPKLQEALNHWAKGYVKEAEDLGMDIVSDDVDLNRPATRGEVVRMVLEALGIKPDAISTTSFSDLSKTHKHAAFIEYAKELGIVSGDANATTFRPDAPINRAEAAKIANQIVEIILGGSGN